MTIQTRKFVLKNVNSYHIKYGWRMEDRPHFDPCHQHFVVCHDTFEHHEDDVDALEDEMLAFGSVFYIRCGEARWPRWETHNDMIRSLYTDINYFLKERKWEIKECNTLLPADPVLSALVRDFMEYASKRERTNLTPRDWLTWEYNYAAMDTAEYTKRMTAYQNALCWTFIGYVRAKARWGMHSQRDVLSMFTTVTEVLNKYSDGTEDDSLSITFDTETLEVVIHFDLRPHRDSYWNINNNGSKRTVLVSRNAKGDFEYTTTEHTVIKYVPEAVAA